MPELISINVSGGGIPKAAVDVAQVTVDGITGDGHDHDKHNTPLQAISIIDVEDLDDLRGEGFAVGPGATGENFTCRGLDVDTLAAGDRLTLSGGLELELTKRRKPCYVLDAIHEQLKVAIRERCGFYAKVVRGGVVRPGEHVAVETPKRRNAETSK